MHFSCNNPIHWALACLLFTSFVAGCNSRVQSETVEAREENAAIADESEKSIVEAALKWSVKSGSLIKYDQTQGKLEKLASSLAPWLDQELVQNARKDLASQRSRAQHIIIFEDDEQSLKMQKEAPQFFAELENAKRTQVDAEKRVKVLQGRIQELEEEAGKTPELIKLQQHLDQISDDFSAEKQQKKMAVEAERATFGARTLNEKLRRMGESMEKQMKDWADAITAETARRSQRLGHAKFHYVWKQLRNDEQRLLLSSNPDYVLDAIRVAKRIAADDALAEAQQKVKERVPTARELRRKILAVHSAMASGQRNMLIRAQRDALGFGGSHQGIRADVMAEQQAKRDVELTLDQFGTKLAPALAELAFDQNADVARQATSFLRSLGKDAGPVVAKAAQAESAPRELRFALDRFFPSLAPTLSIDKMWSELKADSQFRYTALEKISNSAKEFNLSPERMRIIKTGIKSYDDAWARGCINIAVKTKNIDGDTIQAIVDRAMMSDSVRMAAAAALPQLGQQARFAIPQLVKQFIPRPQLRRTDIASQFAHHQRGRKSRQERLYLARLIESLKPTAEDIQPLVVVFADKYEKHDILNAAAKLVKQAGPNAVVPLIELLKSSNDRETILESLGMIGLADDYTLTTLDWWLKQGNEKERKAAAKSLGNLGESASSTIPTLMLMTNDRQIGRDAGEALTRIIKKPTGELLVQLAQMVDHHDIWVAASASKILRQSGPDARPILPIIMQHSRAKKSHTRRCAARLLQTIDTPTPDVIGRLVQMMSDRDSYVQRDAVESLASYGTAASSAVPTLVDRVRKKSSADQYDAVWALMKINISNSAVIDALKQMHGKRGPSELQRYSATALVHFGEPVAPYIRDLHYLTENAYSSKDRQFANIAAPHLHLAGYGNRKSKRILQKLARSTDPELKQIAERALNASSQ